MLERLTSLRKVSPECAAPAWSGAAFATSMIHPLAIRLGRQGERPTGRFGSGETALRKVVLVLRSTGGPSAE